jgi:hypothetical protein
MSDEESISGGELDYEEEKKRKKYRRQQKRAQKARVQEEEMKMRNNQAYNEKSIYNDNRNRIDNFTLKVSPPVEDYSRTTFKNNVSSTGNDGALSMQYNAYYGNPYTLQRKEYELNKLYNGNVTILPSGGGNGGSQSGTNDPLWNESLAAHNSDSNSDDDIDNNVFGRVRKDGTYYEEINPGNSKLKTNKEGTGKGGSKPLGGPVFSSQDQKTDDMWRVANAWQYEKDPYGSGKSYLLRELKRKFLEMTSPIVDFVSTYLAMTGHQSEDDIYEKIKMLSQVEKANPMNASDFPKLVNHLYSEDVDIANALIGHLSKHVSLEKDKIKLAKLQKDYWNEDRNKKKDLSAAKKQLQDLKKHISELDMLLAEHDNYKDMARKLRESYEYVASGNIVFVLNNVFRNEAQMVLDEINGYLHGKHTKRYFTLLEIMNSSYVRAKFIRMMIITKTSINVGGVTPISMLATSGSLGNGNTVADRMNNGSYRGNGDLNKTIVIQSRPTQANLVAGSLEYLEGLNLFKRVKKKNDGSNSLIIDTDGNSLIYGRGSQSSFYTSHGAIPALPKSLSYLSQNSGPYGSSDRSLQSKRKRLMDDEEDEIFNDIYYDVISNTYKNRRNIHDVTEMGVAGSYEESLGVFIKEKELRNKKKRNMLVENEEGDFLLLKKGYGDPIRNITDLQRQSKGDYCRGPSYNTTAASYIDPSTGRRGLVSPLIMNDPLYARHFYSTGRPAGPYNLANMLTQRSEYK